ncbi:MAG: DUF402 domain-containing protein [Anaerolineaceae bacterium]|nr:DUF402 domain-containing protein [Anaerolineaceae bacterium]
MKAIIHFARIGKKEVIYTEGLVRDNGTRLDTCTVLPVEAAGVWSKSAWKGLGILSNGETVHTVRKHHFYNEWFDIIELFDASGAILGYYCDITTPLRKVKNEYYVQDLLLDLWIFPDGSFTELDWDEFNEAVQQGMLSLEYQEYAVKTMRLLVEEIRKGIFPQRYLDAFERR